MSGKRILLVEDDAFMRGALERALAREGYQVTASPDGFSAIEAVKREEFDLVIADVRMPGIDGLEVVAQVKEHQPAMKSFVITAYASEEAPVRAINLGVDAYLKKPFELDDLLRMVRERLQEQVRYREIETRFELEKGRHARVIRILAGVMGIDQAAAAVRGEQDGDQLEALLRHCALGVSAAAKSAPLGEGRHAQAGTLVTLGISYATAGQHEVAVHAFQQALAMLDRDGGGGTLKGLARIQLAKLFLSRGVVTEAIPLLIEASGYAEGNPALTTRAHLLLAWAHFKLGDRAAAGGLLAECHALAEEWQSPLGQVHLALYKTFFSISFPGDSPLDGKPLSTLLGQTESPDLLHFLAEERDVAGVVLLHMLLHRSLPSHARSWLQGLRPLESDVVKSWMDTLTPAEQQRIRESLHDPAAQPTLLQILAFGLFRICRGSVLVEESEWKRKKAKSVLALLLLHDRITSDELVDRLWPDADMEKGKERLQTIVYHLRRVLEPSLQEGQSSKYLLFERNAYVLGNRDQIYCDLWQFRDRMAAARKLFAAGEKDKAAVALSEGTQLYIASFYEDGQEEWWGEWRDQIREEYLAGLERLAAYYEGEGKFPQAIAAARRLLEVERSREEGHLVLMRTYLAQNNRTQAMKQFQLYKAALKTDLDLDPSPAAQKLFLAIGKAGL